MPNIGLMGKKKEVEASPSWLKCFTFCVWVARDKQRQSGRHNKPVCPLMGRESRCDPELTQTPGSIDRGVKSLGTLAEVAANSIIAFTHATKTRNVWTLIQICTEERMETRHGHRILKSKGHGRFSPLRAKLNFPWSAHNQTRHLLENTL